MTTLKLFSSTKKWVDILFDDEDYALVDQYYWWVSDKTNYPNLVGRLKNNYKAPKVKMSRLIMQPVGDFVVDHINRNPLDNRRENLRIVTQAENLLNKSEQSNNTSGERHIFYDKSLSKNKWKICIQRNKKMKHFGVYPTKEDAKNALELIIKTQL